MIIIVIIDVIPHVFFFSVESCAINVRCAGICSVRHGDRICSIVHSIWSFVQSSETPVFLNRISYISTNKATRHEDISKNSLKI